MQSAKQKERELIVSLHKKGKSTRDIAFALDVSKSKAGFWVKRFRETKSLDDIRRSGRPPSMTEAQLAELRATLHDTPPAKYGGEKIGWTSKMVLQYIHDHFGVLYGLRQVQKLLHKLGLSLITPRSEHQKGSYAARTVFRMDFKKNSRRNIWVPTSFLSTK